MKNKTTQYRDSEDFFNEIDAHIKEYAGDFESRNHFIKTANRLLLDSRRNKGKFKVYK